MRHVDDDCMSALAEVGTVAWRGRAGLGGRCVIVDIDGVLADASWRQHLLDGPGRRRNWDAFFDAAAGDPPLQPAIDALAGVDPDAQVVLVTGRPARLAGVTVEWLRRYGVRWDALVLRSRSDYTAAARYKVRVLDALRAADVEVVAAFDDDAAVLDAYRARGLGEVAVSPTVFGDKPLK